MERSLPVGAGSHAATSVLHPEPCNLGIGALQDAWLVASDTPGPIHRKCSRGLRPLLDQAPENIVGDILEPHEIMKRLADGPRGQDMIFGKVRLTLHERRCAREFAGDCPTAPWDHLYEIPPFELMEMAERGEPKAAYVMGDRLDQGMGGLEADPRKAVVFYRLGEKQDDPDALNNIGSMHFHGDGLPKDLGIARGYFERAAEGGCAAAMNNLGRMHLDGAGGLSVDIERGLALLERGARLYDVNAALKMQNIYHEGQYDQPVDAFRRIYWLWHAAYNGSGRAYAIVADYLREGKAVRHQGARARRLYERGMMLDDSYATLQLGVDCLAGKCGPRDLDKALHFLTMAEQMGETFATACIARLQALQARQ